MAVALAFDPLRLDLETRKQINAGSQVVLRHLITFSEGEAIVALSKQLV